MAVAGGSTTTVVVDPPLRCGAVAELRGDAFPAAATEGRGFRQVFTHVNSGGVPLLLVHGWPETRRIWWKTIEPYADAGFEVIAPDLRGFGDSDVAPDGFHDVPAHSRARPRPPRTRAGGGRR